MKKFLDITLILAIIASFSLTGCIYENKYDDGPVFRLQTKKMRLVNEWKIEKVFYDGIEQPTDPLWDNQTCEFKRNGDYVYTISSGTNVGTYTGTWDWYSLEKEMIEVSLTSLGTSSTSKILRLKANELWLEDGSFETHYVSK